jgi:hypothetical protein
LVARLSESSSIALVSRILESENHTPATQPIGPAEATDDTRVSCENAVCSKGACDVMGS